MCEVVIAPKPKQKRERQEYEPGAKFIRRVKGRSFQARVWVSSPPFGSVNLGLFRGEDWQDDVVGERMAYRVAAEYAARAKRVGADPVTVFLEMQREGLVPSHVLPPGVIRLPGGGFASRRRVGKRGPRVLLPGPFESAEAASRALGHELERVMLAEESAPRSQRDGRGCCAVASCTRAARQG